MAGVPSLTPNVRIENPKARKIVGNVLGWAGVAITATTIVDAAVEQVDLAYVTEPAAAIFVGLFGLFQLLVTSPNVPAAQGWGEGGELPDAGR